MSRMGQLFSGILLWYQLWMLAMAISMVLLAFLKWWLVGLIDLSISAVFFWIMDRLELKATREKGGQRHADVRYFRSKEYHEEVVISFKKPQSIELSSLDELEMRTKIEHEPEYKNALKFELQAESKDLRDYEKFMIEYNAYQRKRREEEQKNAVKSSPPPKKSKGDSTTK